MHAEYLLASMTQHDCIVSVSALHVMRAAFTEHRPFTHIIRMFFSATPGTLVWYLFEV